MKEVEPTSAGATTEPATGGSPARRKAISGILGNRYVMSILGAVAIAALVGGMIELLPSRPSPEPFSGNIERIEWRAAAQPPKVRFDFGPYFAAFGDHLLMLGTSGSTTAVWSSTDGSAWSQVSDSGAFETAGRRFVALGFSDDGTGGLVVVGNGVGISDNAVTATAWQSHDGRVWTQAQVDAVPGAQMLGVAARPGAVVAVGSGGAWFSAGGRAWAQVAVPGLGQQYAPQLVGSWNGGFALVARWTGDGPAHSGIWLSQDGQAWTPARTSLTGSRASQILGDGDRIVVVGGGEGDAISATATSWSSTDGETWTKTVAPASGTAVPMNSVTELGGNLVAVGDSAITRILGAAAPPTPPSIWVSGDAGTWQQVRATAPALADPQLAVLANHVVLAGPALDGSALTVLVGDIVSGN